MLSRICLRTRPVFPYQATVLQNPKQTCQDYSDIRSRISIQTSYCCRVRHMNSGSDKNCRGDLGRRKYEALTDSFPDEDNLFCEREFKEMNVEDFEELYKNDESIKEYITIVLNEYEHTKYETVGRVPSQLTIKEMKMIIEETASVQSRANMIHYLFKREMDKRTSQRKKLKLKEEIKKRLEARGQERNNEGVRTGLLSPSGDLLYGLWHNTLFSRVPENMLKQGLSGTRLRAAAQFGRKLIFDFGFEDYMNNHARRNSADQIQEAYGMNRYDYKEPFDLWFCNFDDKTFTGQYLLNNALKGLYDKTMITVSPDCMTKHFDKSQLVYLSPNAREPLGQIGKSDDIYIVGVYNDKGNSQPLSLRKANKMGIRAKCLPLDSHLLWRGPSKALCVNHVVGVLLEVISNGGDWYSALKKHIPLRKIKSKETILEEERIRTARYEKKFVARKTKIDFDKFLAS